MAHSRRTFVRNTAAGAILATPALNLLWKSEAKADGFGPLLPDPAGILDLPEGFSYRLLQERGDIMSDGYRVPGLPDGMGVFPGPAANTVVLMRNHENDDRDGAYGRGDAPAEAYTSDRTGGVTRVVVDLDTLEVVSSNLVLSGTVRNCAGGISPYGWLTCEETLDRGHGFVFLTDADAESIQPPERIDGYGRFNHEAAVIDPDTMIGYLTEDDLFGCFYRFVPDDPNQPFVGKLQALRVVGEDRANTSLGRSVGDAFEIGWVDISDPVPSSGSTKNQGQSKGAATFARGEGLWLHGGDVYFSCTAGGGFFGDGQIFKLTPEGDGGVLEIIAQPEDSSVLQSPDNICVAPWGDVYVAEDGGSPNLVRVVTTDGELFDFAKNAASGSEIAGVCFSPDGSTLFLNVQKDHRTFAVTGPFPQMEPPDEPGGDGDGDGDTTTGGDGDGDTTTGGDGDGDTTTTTTTSGGDGDTTSSTGGDGDGDTTGGTGGDGCAVGGTGNATGLAAAAVGVAVSAAVAGRRGGDSASGGGGDAEPSGGHSTSGGDEAAPGSDSSGSRE